MLYEKLIRWLRIAPQGSIPLTGILGLAVLAATLYHFRNSHRSSADRRRQEQQQDHERQRRPHSQPSGSSQPPAASPSPLPPAPSALQTTVVPSNPAIPIASSVRSAMTGVKRVSMSVPGVLLHEWQAHELSDSATTRPELIDLVHQIAAIADLYLIAHVMDDVGQATVTGALEDSGVIGHQAGTVKPHRMLFCSTLEGKISIVRQLEPDLHIDGHTATIQDLQRFMPQLLHIKNPEAAMAATQKPTAPNVAQCSSLSEFFGV